MKPRGLLSNSIVYGLGSVANRLIGLLFLAVYTRYLTPTDYGIVGLLSSISMLLLPLFSFGLSTSLGVCYFATADPVRRDRVIRSGQALCAISVALLLLIAIAASDSIAAFIVTDAEYAPHTIVAIAGVALSLISLPLQQQLQFEARALAYVAASLAGVAANVAATLVAVVLLDLAALGLLFGTAVGQAITWMTLAALTARRRAAEPADFRVMSDLLRHGLPMVPSFGMLFVIQNGVRWPLEWYHGMGAVGVYTIGTTIGAAITIVTTSVASAWMPHTLSQAVQWPQVRTRIADDFLRYCIFGGILVALFFVGAQVAVHVFVASEFHRAWTVVGLSAASHVLMSLFSLMLPPLYLAKKVGWVLISQAIAMVATVGAFGLVAPFEIVGSALAVLAGSAALVLAQWGVNKRVVEVAPIPFNVPALTRVACIIGVAGLVSYRLRVDDTLLFVVASTTIVSAASVGLVRELPGGWQSIFSKGNHP